MGRLISDLEFCGKSDESIRPPIVELDGMMGPEKSSAWQRLRAFFGRIAISGDEASENLTADTMVE